MTQDLRPDWGRARRISYQAATALADESVALADATGRRLSGDLLALCNLPHYASSAMDGWAVAGSAPWTIVARAPLGDAQAIATVTGAAIPAGATAILRGEHAVQFSDGSRELLTTTPDARADEPRPGDHLRAAGTEAVIGERLIAAGRILNPAHIALAAAAGNDRLAVAARPRIALVSTGDEVVERGIPRDGEVRDSFGPVLPPLLRQLGAVTKDSIHISDSLSAMTAALSRNPSVSDVVITTGGTGRSGADHLHGALAQLGAPILIDGVRMRPGGPSLLARLPDGRLLIGLPGNPLAALLALFTLGEPLFAALTGGPEPTTGSVVAGVDLAGRPDTSRLVPFRRVEGVAVPTGWRASAMIRGLAESDGVMICPPDGAVVGQVVPAIRLPWNP